MRVLKIKILFLWILFGINQFVSSQEIKSQFEVFPLDLNSSQKIANLEDSSFIMEIFINGIDEPVLGYVDTGATSTVISERLGNRLNFTPHNDTIYAAQISKHSLPLQVSAETISIGIKEGGGVVTLRPLILLDETLQSSAQPTFSELFRHVDLIVGTDFLNNTRTTISPSEPRILISVADGQQTEYSRKWNFSVNIMGEDYSCKLDSAADYEDGITFLRTHESYDTLKSKFKNFTWSYNGLSQHGWTDTAYDPSARIAGLEGRGLLIHFEPGDAPHATETDITASAKKRCVIGLGAFNQATIHYNKGSLFLEGKHAPIRYNRSGFKLAFYSAKNEVLWVRELWPNSYAAKNGLHDNIVISAINRRPLAAEDILSIQDLLYDKPGTEIELEWYEGPDQNGKFNNPEPKTTFIRLSETLE